MITSRKKKKWIFPKGIIEPGLSAKVSALQEADEEAGLKGVAVGNAICEYSYNKWGGTCKVKVFIMIVSEMMDDWFENFRKRKIFNIDEAIEKIEIPELKRILKNLPEQFL